MPFRTTIKICQKEKEDVIYVHAVPLTAMRLEEGMVFRHCDMRLLVLADKEYGPDIAIIATLAGNAPVTAAMTTDALKDMRQPACSVGQAVSLIAPRLDKPGALAAMVST